MDEVTLTLIFDELNTVETFSKVAKTGEWTLYEAQVRDWDNLELGDMVHPQMMASVSAMMTEFFVDDVRMQPLDSKMMAYVYDNNSMRILSAFDDQNFSLQFEYNEEGKLIRKIRETTKGLKTIEETQYHQPRVNR